MPTPNVPRPVLAPSDIPALLQRHATRVVASLLIAAFLGWLLWRGGLPLVPDAEALSTVSVPGAAAYLVLLSLTMWLRTYRWVYLLRPIADVRPMRIVAIGLLGNAAILFAPLRAGELARPILLARDGEIGLARATATVVAERVIDGLALSVIGFVGLTFSQPVSPLPNHLGSLPVPVSAIPGAATTALLVFGAAFLATLAFFFARDLARRLTLGVLGVISVSLANWVTRHIENLADGLTFLSSREHGLPFARDTALYWLMSLGAFATALQSCGIAPSPAEVCLCLCVIGLGSLVPSGPGMFGTYQLALFAALAMFYPEETVLTSGAAVVFLTYTAQCGITLIAAIAGYVALVQASPAAAEEAPP